MKIFIAVVAGVIVGALLLKYWKKILAFFALILLGALMILTIPLSVVSSLVLRRNVEVELVKAYDKCFFVTDNLKGIKRNSKVINEYEKKLNMLRREREYKEGTKLLNEAKWVI